MKHGIFLMAWIFTVAFCGIFFLNSDVSFAGFFDNPIIPYSKYYSEWNNIQNRDNINDAERTDLRNDFDKKYDSAKLSFTGTITEISTKYNGYKVALSNNINGIPFQIDCYFERSEKKDVYALRNGHMVSVVGELYFSLQKAQMARLNNCKVMK